MSTDDTTPSTDAPAAPKQEESHADALDRRYAHARRNQFLGRTTGDTLARVVGGLALLSRIADDSEDHDPDAEVGKYHLIDSLRLALEFERDHLPVKFSRSEQAQESTE